MTNYNLNSGYGQMLAMQIANSVGPNFGNVLVVVEDSDNSDVLNTVKEAMVPDPDGRVRFFSTLQAAYTAAVSNNNDVILMSAHSSHSVTTGIAWTKSRIHVIGMDGGDRLIQQGCKISGAAADDTGYVLKVTGTRNSFRNLKFIQNSTDAAGLTCVQMGGEGNLYKNCSFTFGTATNLDGNETTTYEVVCGEDSGTFINCMFGQATLLTTGGRAVMAVDQVTASQEMKDCIFKDCQWWMASSSTDANFIRILANTDAKFNNVFINPIMMNALVGSQSAAAVDDAVDSVSGLVEGSFLFVHPATNATEFCTGVSDQMEVVGPATDAATGEAVTPA